MHNSDKSANCFLVFFPQLSSAMRSLFARNPFISLECACVFRFAIILLLLFVYSQVWKCEMAKSRKEKTEWRNKCVSWINDRPRCTMHLQRAHTWAGGWCAHNAIQRACNRLYNVHSGLLTDNKQEDLKSHTALIRLMWTWRCELGRDTGENLYLWHDKLQWTNIRFAPLSECREWFADERGQMRASQFDLSPLM